MLKFTFLVRRAAGMSREDFIDYHRNKHAPLFISIPEAKQYVKKYVISHPVAIEASHPKLTEPSNVLSYDAVTDIYFDSLADFDNFFTSENYKQKVQPDELNFLDLTDAKMVVLDEKTIIS
ncbi:EthD domain-containing protein [Olivibacter jilunii]|uniref:EthD domain-containing protein n=1 Tax=Olivibacter jilunii TaxID=985016 RepID=UPI003F16EB42